MQEFLAHISEDGQRQQTVLEHLRGTAALAGQFGEAFGCAEDAYSAAILHDIGKYSAEFQRRIHGAEIHVDHSTAGAQELFRKYHRLEAAFAVAGHHGGLPDGGNRRNDTADQVTFFGRMKRAVPDYSPWQSAGMELTSQRALRYQDLLEESFYIRMLYSCLVDADYLDTETFMQGAARPKLSAQGLETLAEKVREKAKQWLHAEPAGTVGVLRNQVLRRCIQAGQQEQPGLFTLTVPTGGGKTFASLAFAMEHALAREKSRIVYVIPYTSIIDQTADNFCKLLGEENVLAHYSAADYRTKDADNLTPLDYRRQLASENWDAPVIVTTAVQFFESLYASRPAKCRKLHNLANSVIIFDEAQTFPLPYLRPCVAAIAMLVKDYGATAVLCTATQPALGELFREYGLVQQEIIPEPETLAEQLRRFTLESLGPLDMEVLAQRLAGYNQALCVVNRRKTARDLAALLPEEGRFCLTTLLCPYDRKRLLEEIRRRLKDGLPCRVVSTSLIEAGVDVDFPVAYREEAGLDSILQAGGRCNREGLRSLTESKVYIFSLREQKPPVMLKQNINALHQAIQSSADAASLAAVQTYFESLRLIKGSRALDMQGILEAFSLKSGCLLPFAEVSKRFRLIDAPTRTVYIPIVEGKELCARLLDGEVGRGLLRQVGLYGVTIYPQEYAAMVEAGAVEPICEDGGILVNPVCYSQETGLNIGGVRVEDFFC